MISLFSYPIQIKQTKIFLAIQYYHRPFYKDFIENVARDPETPQACTVCTVFEAVFSANIEFKNRADLRTWLNRYYTLNFHNDYFEILQMLIKIYEIQMVLKIFEIIFLKAFSNTMSITLN